MLVADEFPVVRRGVAAAVRRRWDMTLAGEAADGPTALEMIRSLRPAVALIEDTLPKAGDGLQVVSTLAEEGCATRVLMFSEHADGRDVQRAIAAGASGFLSKRESMLAICDAIRGAAVGERYLSREAEIALLDHLRDGEPLAAPKLTAREREVLRLTAEGVTSAEISLALHLSNSTVKNHQRHLYAKLGVANAPAAVYRAMREGILR